MTTTAQSAAPTLIQIKSRCNGAVLFSVEMPADVAALPSNRQLGWAVKKAVEARANLADAYLADAYLADANLADANLEDANLAGANLAGAYLAGAYLAGANLADAYLADAYLADAYLAGANLAGANLADAYLADAYLAGAYLADAYLADAYLADAYLADAYLADAYLAGAYLAGAYLAGANLAGAYLADAYLADAYLADARNVGETNGSESVQTQTLEEWRAKRATNARERALRYRERNPDVPVVEALDAKMLEIIEAGQGALEMGSWHSCETTHCRAGWAIHLAGKPGYDLESRFGDSARAGAAIYRASVGYVPHFYASNARAMEDIRRRAAEQASA